MHRFKLLLRIQLNNKTEHIKLKHFKINIYCIIKNNSGSGIFIMYRLDRFLSLTCRYMYMSDVNILKKTRFATITEG